MAVKYNIQDYITLCKLIQLAIIRYFTLNMWLKTHLDRTTGAHIADVICEDASLLSDMSRVIIGTMGIESVLTEPNVRLTPPFGAAAQH